MLTSEEFDIDYLLEYPLSFTGLYKTRINVRLNHSHFFFYYNFVNSFIDLLAGFGMYSNKNYEYWCKSDNVYTVGFSDISIIFPTTHDNVVNDITLPQHYDHLKLRVSSAYIEINGPNNNYKGNDCFTFNILLGEQLASSGAYPVLLSFKHHERHPLNQVRSGQKEDHYIDCLGCDSLMIKGDYHFHGVISEEVQDTMFLTIIMSSPKLIFYAEIYPFLLAFIENVIGVNMYTITEEEYHATQNSNRQSFFFKYFNDYRQHKKNVVFFHLLLFTSS